MAIIKSSAIGSVQLLDDRIVFNDNVKRLWYVRLAAVICWFLFSIINCFRFIGDPSLTYLFMSVFALGAGMALGYSIFKETTRSSIPLSDISKVVIKNFPTNKLHGRVVTKNKKFRPFSLSKDAASSSHLTEFLQKNNIVIHEG